MPAGDAGLERQLADAEYRAICAWVTEHGFLNAPMAERVRQLLHRQQAVVERAREALNCLSVENHVWDHEDRVWDHQGDGACLDELDKALRALDQAQAVQPEGEPR